MMFFYDKYDFDREGGADFEVPIIGKVNIQDSLMNSLEKAGWAHPYESRGFAKLSGLYILPYILLDQKDVVKSVKSDVSPK